MFRRSKSNSNIPLRKVNLFGSDNHSQGTSSRRSQSATRFSHRDSKPATVSAHQIRQSRTSSLDRKSNTLGLPRLTPVTRAGSRAGSLQKTTPNSAKSQGSSSRGTTPTTSYRQERKVTIQKLATDKKWVAAQFHKVQQFIAENSDIFDHSIVTAKNIKPPSINIFIYVTHMLLLAIFPKIQISFENYKEVIPAKLKIMHYPGTLTGSVLKTVNTMHSWPQVIGMWSWLIDKVKLSKSADDASFIDHLEPEARQNYLLHQNCSEYLAKRYKIFNNDHENSEEEVQKVKCEYINKLSEIVQIDYEGYERLKQDVDEKKKYRDKQLLESEHLKEEMSKMQSEIKEMKQEMEDFQDKAAEESDLDAELQLLQDNLKELRNARIAKKENIKQLEEDIKMQPCTYQEKMSLFRQVDELKNEIEVKKKKIENAQEIKNKFDHQLTSEISKIQAIVVQWNLSLREPSISKPELSKLLLREKGFHDPQFLKEIQEKLDQRVAIEKEYKTNLVKVKKERKRLEWEKKDIQKDIEELTEILERNDRKCDRMEEIIAETKNDIKQLTTVLDQKRESHVEQMKNLQEMARSKAEEENRVISELKEQNEHLKVEVRKFGQKMLSFFIEMHNQVTNNIKEMTAIRNNVAENLEGRAASALEKQQQLIEVLQSFNGGEPSSSNGGEPSSVNGGRFSTIE